MILFGSWQFAAYDFLSQYGVSESTKATAAKASLLKWIRVSSNFVAFIPVCWKCQMKANLPVVDFLGTALKLRKRKKRLNVCLKWKMYLAYPASLQALSLNNSAPNDANRT